MARLHFERDDEMSEIGGPRAIRGARSNVPLQGDDVTAGEQLERLSLRGH